MRLTLQNQKEEGMLVLSDFFLLDLNQIENDWLNKTRWNKNLKWSAPINTLNWGYNSVICTMADDDDDDVTLLHLLIPNWKEKS